MRYSQSFIKYYMLYTNFVHLVFIFVIQLYRFGLRVFRSAPLFFLNIGCFFFKWKNMIENYEKDLLM